MKTKWMILTGIIALCGMAPAGFVTIVNPGNAADGTTGYGAVGYTYKISATEVTIAEFMASGAGNGNENYYNNGIDRNVGPNAPAGTVSLYETMQYCNWLTSGNVYTGAYVFSSGVYQSTDRATAITTYGTVYALPTEDEWYKAAYFKPDASGYSLYANGTGAEPVAGTDANYSWAIEVPWVVGTGRAEQNGTYDMMGNVWEWMEDSGGVMRGGGFGNYGANDLRSSDRIFNNPAEEFSVVGFRVVAIPEPATALSLVLGGLIITGYRRFFGRI